MRKMALVFVGGCVGVLARLWIINLFSWLQIGHSIAVINCAGSALLGVIFAYTAVAQLGQAKKDFLSLGVGTGFCGAFTTFSSFAMELVASQKPLYWDAGYAVGITISCIICAAAGYYFTERLVRSLDA